MTEQWDAVATRLVTDRGDSLTRYAYLLIGDADEAADFVQEALVRVFSKPRLGLSVERAESYVRRAILNAVIDRSRRDQNWRSVRHLVSQPDSVPSADTASDDRLDLAQLVRELSPRQSACIVLRYYDDLTVDGIARVLGIRAGSVKRYLSDGLRALSVSIDPAGVRARSGGDHVAR